MPDEFALQARYVFPVCGPPMANATVTGRGERIVAVTPAGGNRSTAPVDDLGDLAIVPGLVNAHTHLEFSDLEAPLGEPGMTLPNWIRLVVAQRRAASQPTVAAVQLGMREALQAGTTALGDIATSNWPNDARFAAGEEALADAVVFRECIAPVPGRIAEAMALAEAFAADGARAECIHPALSPHAPYTVQRRLLASLVELARQQGLPVAMHLAESREELELLQRGAGPFHKLLVELDAWDPDPTARCRSALEYLEYLARAPRALVIHGNYLSDAELDFLAARAATMSVVYCPRTHAWFGHPRYPLAAMLDRGISVALGTDSRASNPDLSLWAEMQFVARRHPELSLSKLLELGTLGGARALGLDDQLGTLEPGKLANLAIVKLGGDRASDPHERLLAPETRVVGTYLRGTRLVPTAGSS